jgi:hypothetical protein
MALQGCCSTFLRAGGGGGGHAGSSSTSVVCSVLQSIARITVVQGCFCLFEWAGSSTASNWPQVLHSLSHDTLNSQEHCHLYHNIGGILLVQEVTGPVGNGSCRNAKSWH